MKLTTGQTRLLGALAEESDHGVTASYLCQRLTGVPINKVDADQRLVIQQDIAALRGAGLVRLIRSGDDGERITITIHGRVNLRWGRRTWECRFATLLGLGLHPIPREIKAPADPAWFKHR
ncbi:MAG: hypothetical protein J7605_12840 [Variovorax sp.]|nr:hypothetical protein [Variovorax sp.]